MSDLINREDAIAVFGDVHPLDHNANAYLSKIKALPSVPPSKEVVAEIKCEIPDMGEIAAKIKKCLKEQLDNYIVRCKDCKFFIPEKPCVGGTYTACDALVGGDGCCMPVREDFYCAYGERRENESI